MARPKVFDVNNFGNSPSNDGGLSQFNASLSDSVTLTQDGVGGGGGVSVSTVSNIFVLNISSNETGFVTLVNGEVTSNNKEVRISRESLLTESKKIEIQKEGFTTDEYYIIEMLADGSPVIINSTFQQPLGISTKDVTLTKYIGDSVDGQPISIQNSVSSQLTFKLNKKVTKVDDVQKNYKLTFKISGTGTPVSVLKNGKKSAEFFPTIGVSTYEDVDGTNYTIRSSNSLLHRITSIDFSGLNAPQNIIANDGESLEVSLTLKSDYDITIVTEEVKQSRPAANPKIELINSEARTYNINSSAGVPLMFKKNIDVKTITIIVGDDILEFDNLDAGDLCGITIPHRVFKNIGKYNVKIFPFSLDEYEKEVRPETPKVKIQPKVVTPKYNVTEVLEEAPTTIEEVYNPYSPVVENSGGGGGGLGSQLILDSQQGELFTPEKVNYGKPREAQQ